MNKATLMLSKESIHAADAVALASVGASGYMGKKDKDKGKNNIGVHAAGHGLAGAASGALGGAILGGKKYAIGGGITGALMGSAVGAGAYGLGRLASDGPKRKRK